DPQRPYLCSQLYITLTVVTASVLFTLSPDMSELDYLLAQQARIRRPTGLELPGEIINHKPLELIGFVNNVMRNTKGMRHAARISYCLRAATFVLRAGDAILRPDFHRDTDHFVTLFAQQISGDARSEERRVGKDGRT